MMKHNKNKNYSTLVLLFAFIFSIHTLKAQGPNAPEAASFEPVDATDMVNLVTGDLSYVLPLLNVPSPEGGYPISLSYHAGIAMEQEASWVGLGWSLNPGAINRGVNGYPDDWGRTNVSEFFYDAGWEENFYSFSAGVTLGGGVSVGLGLSWGSNQSLGGYVSASIGLGEGKGAGSVGVQLGTNGASINGSFAGFSASVGTNGVGLGYGIDLNSDEGKSQLGIGLNYNYNSGLSGGISVSHTKGTFNNKKDGVAKTSGMGVNFSSQGVSINAKVNGFGIGVSNSTYGVSSSDYNVDVSTSGFFIPAYIFYLSYSHTNIKYSLFKINNLYTSGMLYPMQANSTKRYTNTSGYSKLLKENTFMDVTLLPKYTNDMETTSLLNNLDQIEQNNLLFPSYDNYSVSAQGLSGSLKPYIHFDVNLSARGRSGNNPDNLAAAYINNSFIDYSNTFLNQKIDFTFYDAHSSFLRLKTNNIVNTYPTNQELHSDFILNDIVADRNFDYHNSNSLVGGVGRKKREGNVIKTYTNKEIRDSYENIGGKWISNLKGFVDATQYDAASTVNDVLVYLRRYNTNTFLNQGIGAYQITTTDGKTYHYSLPVYNFESYYKNFQNEDDENSNFFEIQKTKPYATHWLLTGITGPDYVDMNSNGFLDEGDYGYWVAFEYGKWTDGYMWETPNGYNQIDENTNGDKTYSYSWGRKQVYYLDAVRTRTHTALFVKGLRSDDMSSTKPNTWKEKWNSGSFDQDRYAEKINSAKVIENIYSSGDLAYDSSGSLYTVTNFEAEEKDLPFGEKEEQGLFGKKGVSRYIDVPINRSLRLEKIILLKNEDAAYNKITGSLTSNLGGKIYANSFYTDLKYKDKYTSGDRNYRKGTLYNDPIIMKEFGVHQHQNILDRKDIEGLGLESKAEQVIDLRYNYSLAKGTHNTTTGTGGRLTLNRLQYRGKGNVALVPPYRFEYFSFDELFNKDNIDDWGYNRGNASIWSLKRIETPTGGNINISYENDSYYAEAATYEPVYFEDVSISANAFSSSDIINVSVNNTSNISPYFKPGREALFSFTREMIGFGARVGKTRFETLVKVGTVAGNSMTLELLDKTEGITKDNVLNMCSDLATFCFSELRLKNNQHPIYALANGKVGGGIRTRSITVNDGVNNIATTEYNYRNPNTNRISGITSYAPSSEAKGIPYVSELPPPMVTYEHVKMINKDGNGNELGSTAYQFGVLEPFHTEPGYIYSLGEAFKVKENQNETISFSNTNAILNKYTIHNCLGSIGSLKSTTTYNQQGQVLTRTINNYKTDLDNVGEIGVTQESYKSYKVAKDSPGSNLDDANYYVSSTSRINYPSVVESTTNTQANYSATTYYDKYDFLSGQILETRTVDSKGREFKTEITPAYTKSDYNPSSGYGMGSKLDDPTNKNMLTQEAMTKTYLKVGNEWEETGIGVTTWNNDWAYTSLNGTETRETNTDKMIWRKHKTYVWDGETEDNGTLKDFDGVDDNFNWAVQTNGNEVTQTNSKWENVSTTTKYDHYSMPLEQRDINNNYASTKMCDGESKVLAVSNAKYTDMYFSSAEYKADNYYGGQVKALRQEDTNAHTGSYSEQINTNEQGFRVNLPANGDRTGVKSNFKVSVWIYKTNHTNARIYINGAKKAFNGEEVFAGNWVLKTHYEALSTGAESVYITSNSGTIYADDFMLHPQSSAMTGYVYNQWDELWYIVGNTGLATRFEYDAAGRLTKTYTEVADFNGAGTGGFKKITESSYHYNNFDDINND